MQAHRVDEFAEDGVSAGEAAYVGVIPAVEAVIRIGGDVPVIAGETIRIVKDVVGFFEGVAPGVVSIIVSNGGIGVDDLADGA